jgi:hypothetical protein
LGRTAIATTGARAARKSLRVAGAITGAFDTAAWLFLAGQYFWSGSDPATKGFDEGAGVAATVLFALTGAPALVLAWHSRAPRTALLLGLAFPAVFLGLLGLVAALLP